MTKEPSSYEFVCRTFHWNIPEFYNIGADVCDRWAMKRNRTAVISVDHRGVQTLSYSHIRSIANRFANVLIGSGAERSDRVAILLPRSLESLLSHVAVFRAGLVAVGLPSSFSAEELEYRILTTGSKAVVTDSAGLTKLEPIRHRLPASIRVYVAAGEDMKGRNVNLESALACASESFTVARTRPDDPAVIAFTTGSTEKPKGVLHAHRAFLAALPLDETFSAPGEVYWTPSDWIWLGGLFPVLAAWRYGMPLLIDRTSRFDPSATFKIIAEHHVRHAVLTPTALKMVRSINAAHPPVRLKSLATGGETLGPDVLGWAEETFGVVVEEMYAQTECTSIAGNNKRLFPVRPGSMGRPVRGHDVQIVDETGKVLERGRPGIIGVRRPDPAIFLGYWNDSEATKKKFAGDFFLTGDIAVQDEDGYLWYVGREDELIKTAGYRVSPLEIESCILEHPSVSLVGVAGVPDPICTQAIKAWVVLKPGMSPSEDLARQIQNYVRTRLAPHQCPRQLRFVTALPRSENGKIIRRALLTLDSAADGAAG